MASKKVNYSLVLLIIIISIFVSAFGFFSNKVVYENKTVQTINGDNVVLYGKGVYYNDSISVASQAIAQDLVTLVVGCPLLIISLLLSIKNSLRGKLLLTGTIGYFLYTYTSYSFLAFYNKFFLFYVILMSLSFFCFIINFTSPELKNLVNHIKPKFPGIFIGIFLIIIGVFLLILWLGRIIPSINKLPAELEHYTTMVIQAMDLGFIVPVAILAGILLFKRKTLGYLLSSIVIVKGTTMLLALVMMIIFMIISGVTVNIIEIMVFPLFSILCIVSLIIILKNIAVAPPTPASQSRTPPKH